MGPEELNDVEDEWVVRMSVRAWRMATELEANCDRCGLDFHMQAGVLFSGGQRHGRGTTLERNLEVR